jgi:putative transposase
MVDKEAPLSVVKQCELLKISRSSVYYQSVPVSEEDLVIMRLIDEVHLRRPFLGSRRMVDELAGHDVKVNRKRVQRLMRLMGLQALYPKPRTSTPAKGHTLYPYLLADLEVTRPNQVWVADISYIPMARGFAYLIAIMDLHSRKILAWCLSNSMNTCFCLEVLQEALERYGSPEVFNTDQGAQFTSAAFTSILAQHNVQISMDGKGRWIDNVFIERFWRSVKYEEVYLHAYEDLRAARAGINRYIDYYNRERRHSSLDRQTPDEVYHQHLSIQPPLIPPVSASGGLTARPCS